MPKEILSRKNGSHRVRVETNVEAALAAGIFHRKEVPISDVKKHLQEEGIEIR